MSRSRRSVPLAFTRLEDRLTPLWKDIPLGGTSPSIRLGVLVSGPSINGMINNGAPGPKMNRLGSCFRSGNSSSRSD